MATIPRILNAQHHKLRRIMRDISFVSLVVTVSCCCCFCYSVFAFCHHWLRHFIHFDYVNVWCFTFILRSCFSFLCINVSDVTEKWKIFFHLVCLHSWHFIFQRWRKNGSFAIARERNRYVYNFRYKSIEFPTVRHLYFKQATIFLSMVISKRSKNYMWISISFYGHGHLLNVQFGRYNFEVNFLFSVTHITYKMSGFYLYIVVNCHGNKAEKKFEKWSNGSWIF